MGTERREGKAYTVEFGWGAEKSGQHTLEVSRTSDIVSYTAEGTTTYFSVEQFEELMRMASTIDYLNQPKDARSEP